MSLARTPVKITTVACEAVLLAAAIWMLRGYVWPTLSSVETAVLQARLDPTLYAGDFVVQESLRFTPRFYYNELVLLPCRLGATLAASFAGWHLVALGGIVMGLRSVARTLGMGAGASAVLVAWLLTVTVGSIGGTYFYTHAPVPAVWAGALVVWGAALAVRGRCAGAYAFFGAAALLQFLVGFYAGILALPLLVRATGKERLQGAGAWLLGLGLVYLPMRLAGATGSAEFGNAEFVEIYAFIRHPHHLVITTWGWPVWVQSGLFYLGAWWLLHKTRQPQSGRIEALVANATLALTAAALLAGYLFIEVHPLALVAKLQPARITPLAQGILLALLALRVHERFSRRDWMGATLLAAAPFSGFPGFLLVLYAVLLPQPQPGFSWRHLVMGLAVLLAFQPLDPSISARAIRYGLWAAIIAVQLAGTALARRPALLAAAAAGVAFIAGVCAGASVTPRWPPFLAARFAIDAPPLDAPGVLGQRFGHGAPLAAVVLVPPGGDTWSFRLYARRAAVVVEKDFPFTDRGIREWQKRVETVLATPLARDLDMTAAWRALSPAQLDAAATRYGARYVLTRDDWHPRLPGKRVDQERGWSLWALP